MVYSTSFLKKYFIPKLKTKQKKRTLSIWTPHNRALHNDSFSHTYKEWPRQYAGNVRHSERSNHQKIDCLRTSVQVQLMAVLSSLYTVTTVAGTVPEQLHSIFNYIRAEYSTDKVVAFNRLDNLTLIWSSKGVFCNHLLSTECDN